MNKKIRIVTVLCGLFGMTQLSAFTPSLYFTSGRMARTAILKAVSGKGKNIPSTIIQATRGLGQKSLADLVRAKTVQGVPSMVASVPVAATLPSAAHVYTTLAAQKESFMRLAHSAFGLAVQSAPKAVAATSAGMLPVVQAAPKAAATTSLAQVAKSVVITPFKKAVAAGCATAATGMGYVGSFLARTQPVAPTMFQSALNVLSQHKMVASGLGIATVTTAYCVHYKINPVTKIKKTVWHYGN